MKKLLLFGIFVLVLVAGCKKASPPEAPVTNTPKRDAINYSVTIVTRTETVVTDPHYNSANGDTLIVKVNGNVVFKSLGSVGASYSTSGNKLPLMKTGDVLNVYYNPGRVYYNSSYITDENGLEVYADYNGNSNMVLKRFSCRCIGNFETTLP